jgi:hypothetical protein
MRARRARFGDLAALSAGAYAAARGNERQRRGQIGRAATVDDATSVWLLRIGNKSRMLAMTSRLAARPTFVPPW